MLHLSREELAWAAGFFDGEGCVYHFSNKSSPTRTSQGIMVSIGQTDPWVLDRFQAAVGGIGKVHGPYSRTPPRKSVWTYRVSNFQEVQAVIGFLWTFLSPIKREQARIALVAGRKQGFRGHRL